MGGIFFVRSGNTTIRKFEDMKGKTAVAVAPNAFGGYRVHLGELNARGYEPETFFGSTTFTGYPMQSVFDVMKQGRADIGMCAPVCSRKWCTKDLLAGTTFVLSGQRRNLVCVV